MIDLIMLRDRTYFQKYPECSEYIREYIPGELYPCPSGITMFNEPEYTRVTKLSEDARIRQPLWRKDLDKATKKRVDNYLEEVK